VTEAITQKIARRIRAEGPLTVAAYMAMALHDPVGGYYARRGPIGAEGDFTTAPEISQIFGELIGLWCAEQWRRMGRPDPVVLAELGPGRGVLMHDLLRAAGIVPGFHTALRLYLVEASPRLGVEQERRLGHARPVWVTRIEDLPGGPMLLIANEFLDALPIRQFVRGEAHWSEHMVALDPESSGDRLVFIDGPESPAATLLVPASLRHSAPGTIVEICPAALSVAGALGARFAREPGAALFFDYGYFPSRPGPTLSAVRQHRPVSAIAAPGTADLSAHVDFAAFAEAARAGGAATHGPVPQGRFLLALGAELRLAALSARASPSQRQALESGVKRLLDPGAMGDLFKVMALLSPQLPSPAGFGTDTGPALTPPCAVAQSRGVLRRHITGEPLPGQADNAGRTG
jgi:NADH dehydrogenase [ubiquinone] 1 alpha subcomplex assembly factor 7